MDRSVEQLKKRKKELKIEVVEMRMPRWISGVTRLDIKGTNI